MLTSRPTSAPAAVSSADSVGLERMYNNRALVPDYARYFEAWRTGSLAARASGAGAQLDLPYGPTALQRLDVFPAANGVKNAPVLFFIHGGYWRSLDKSDHSFIAPAFTAQGVCVVVPNYTLCPSIGIDGIALEMVRALAWTATHAAEHGGDSRRIVVAGHSAGGHLAAMLMACRWSQVDRRLRPDLVGAALSLSGLFDLRPLQFTPFLQADLRLDEATARRCSPALMPRPSRGRLVAVVGGNESPEFLRQNALIRSSWGRTRVPVCESLPGLNHFSVLDALAQPEHRLHQLALALLRSA
jgi:arylformamidase